MSLPPSPVALRDVGVSAAKLTYANVVLDSNSRLMTMDTEAGEAIQAVGWVVQVLCGC